MTSPCLSAEYDCLTYYTLTEILSATHNLITSVTTLSLKIDDMSASIDDLTAKTPNPQAGSILCSEYYTRQDLDGDTLICGIDFYISTDRPKVLDSVPRVGTPVTWQEYQDSHPELF